MLKTALKSDSHPIFVINIKKLCNDMIPNYALIKDISLIIISFENYDALQLI